MPWPVFQWAGSTSAYAFNRAKVRAAGHPQGWLAAKYGIQSVPAAVLLDGETGRLLCADVKRQITLAWATRRLVTYDLQVTTYKLQVTSYRQITLGVGDSETGEPDQKAYARSAALLVTRNL